MDVMGKSLTQGTTLSLIYLNRTCGRKVITYFLQNLLIYLFLSLTYLPILLYCQNVLLEEKALHAPRRTMMKNTCLYMCF